MSNAFSFSPARKAVTDYRCKRSPSTPLEKARDLARRDRSIKKAPQALSAGQSRDPVGTLLVSLSFSLSLSIVPNINSPAERYSSGSSEFLDIYSVNPSEIYQTLRESPRLYARTLGESASGILAEITITTECSRTGKTLGLIVRHCSSHPVTFVRRGECRSRVTMARVESDGGSPLVDSAEHAIGQTARRRASCSTDGRMGEQGRSRGTAHHDTPVFATNGGNRRGAARRGATHSQQLAAGRLSSERQ